MGRDDSDLLILFGLAALGVLAVLALAPSQAGAAAYTNYTDNEDATHAAWLEAPASIGPASLWDRQSGAVNQDWWRFNASAGQLVEIKFRKYTAEPSLGLPGQTWGYWYAHYEVCGPWISSAQIHEYDLSNGGMGGDTTDVHRRESYSFVVPESVGGKTNYFIRVHVDNPQYYHVDWAFYWLNVTVSDRASLDSVRSYSGVMEMRSNQSVDYNFIDTYVIDLTSSNASGDLVRAHLTKGSPDHKVYLDAWELLVFGGTKESFMVNRSYTASGDVDIYFTADHTGQYQIDVFRDFWSVGLTAYTLDVTVTRRALDGDDTHENATEVTRARTFKEVPIEMGYDNHDWWAVRMLAGDTLFKVTVTVNSANITGEAFVLRVYDENGREKWNSPVRNWATDMGTTTYRSAFYAPADGTATIFDTAATIYVRVSVEPEHCARTVKGLATTYNVTFSLSNRVPVLVAPFEDLYAWDEDTTLSIELDSHFSDPDGDAIEYFINNKTAGFATTIADGRLNITPPADWNGEVWWRLRANDRGYSADSKHWVFVDLKLRVLPVDDLPRSNGTVVATCAEDATASVGLTRLFYDVDKGPMGALSFRYVDPGDVPVAVQLDASTGAAVLSPGPDVFGTFNLTFEAFDDQDVPVAGVVQLVVTPVNDAPRIRAALPTVEMTEGDPSTQLDLASYFYDPDGDVLTYVVKVPSSLDGKLNVYNRNNVATESVVIIELLDADYYGTAIVNITARDPSQTTAAQNLRIVVANVPDAAVIEYTPIGNPRAIKEGENTEFKVTDILDPDPTDYGLHTYTWYLDGAVVPDHNESTYTYVANYTDAGQHTIKLEVRDPAGLLASPVPVWTLEVIDVNRAPTASIRELGAVRVTDQEKVNLTVDTNDVDGDSLTVQWFLVGQGDAEDTLLGTGPNIRVKLPAGTQTIEVEVSDGKGGTVRDSTVVTVTKTARKVGGISTGLIAVILVIVIAVVVALLLVSMMRKRKRAQEAEDRRMDLESLALAKSLGKDHGEYEEIH